MEELETLKQKRLKEKQEANTLKSYSEHLQTRIKSRKANSKGKSTSQELREAHARIPVKMVKIKKGRLMKHTRAP